MEEERPWKRGCYDGCCNENVASNNNFAVVKFLAHIPCWYRWPKWAKGPFT